uniref:Uncharacterized protein n=1 Tax=Desulfovibrio sp. U5L TaxID=596152 RepID=I2PWM2_9BACT
MNPDQPVHAVEAKRLRDLTDRIVTLSIDSGALADLLFAKANIANREDDLSEPLHFVARFLERIRDTLTGIEEEMNDLARPDIDLAELARLVRGPKS